MSSLQFLFAAKALTRVYFSSGAACAREVTMSHCFSPLQSFLIVRDPGTSQPSLLCVSAGGEHESVLNYHIKTTRTGTVPYVHTYLFHLILFWLVRMHSKPTETHKA